MRNIYTGLILFFLLWQSTLLAQVKISPLPRAYSQKQSVSTFRTQELSPISLPIWDDFSGNTSGYPDTAFWENSQSVWINSGAGINPPTLNVATFDGLDSLGNPYNTADLFVNGFTDKMISRKIKMTEVPVGLQNTVYLSFFYQWRGNREAPDPTDYLRLEFKNDQGQWETMLTIQEDPSFDRTVFYNSIVPVNAPRFFHDDFQFRFRAFGRLSGPYDSWNIDYVYLNKNRNANDIYFPDRAIASPLGLMFDRYRSVPLRHFLLTKELVPPTFEVYNLQSAATTIDFELSGKFEHYKDGSISSEYEEVLEPSLPLRPPPINLAGIEGQERVFTHTGATPDPDNPQHFDPDADSTFVTMKVVLGTGDNRPISDPPGDYDPAIFAPIDFRVNDTLQATYAFADYYAYDDGEAEYTIELNQSGNRLVYQFELISPEPDTLVAFDIYFPDFALPTSVTTDFYIYQDDEGQPGDVPFTIPSRTISRKGSNAFDRIEFQPALLVQGKFYIGWREPGAGLVKVGFDKNNDTGDKVFVNTNGSWSLADISGSPMIRPVFGSGVVDVNTGVPQEKDAFVVFPNPSDGKFYIRGKFTQLQLIDITGKAIAVEVEESGSDKVVTIPSASAGIYLLRWTDGQTSGTRKIVVQ